MQENTISGVDAFGTRDRFLKSGNILTNQGLALPFISADVNKAPSAAPLFSVFSVFSFFTANNTVFKPSSSMTHVLCFTQASEAFARYICTRSLLNGLLGGLTRWSVGNSWQSIAS